MFQTHVIKVVIILYLSVEPSGFSMHFSEMQWHYLLPNCTIRRSKLLQMALNLNILKQRRAEKLVPKGAALAKHVHETYIYI